MSNKFSLYWWLWWKIAKLKCLIFGHDWDYPAAPAATVKDALRWYYARYDCLPACLGAYILHWQRGESIMRWTKPEDGDVRVVRVFLISPLTLNGETRWLEFARIREKCYWYTNLYTRNQVYRWVKINWVDDGAEV